ncbi:hypothetical protein ACLBWT_19535 [Paenibacillus sp. D51F]
MRKYNTQIESWGPFAEGRKDFFLNPVLKAIGDRYNKSIAQVALRFLIQQAVMVIPKTNQREKRAGCSYLAIDTRKGTGFKTG